MNTSTDYTTDKNYSTEDQRTELRRHSKHSECIYGYGDKRCKGSFKCTYLNKEGGM